MVQPFVTGRPPQFSATKRKRVKVMGRVGAMALALLLAGCETGGLYSAGSATVLVEPTHRAWLKPGSTRNDQNRARAECGDEIASDVEIRNKGTLSDEWSDAAHACMARKGFRYYKER